MKSIEIESWALRVLERVKVRSPIEDSLVELKSTWPEAEKSARRIAAHANAARGEPILWLIGVDEKGGVVGAALQELSSWFPKVEQFFVDVAPSLQHLNVTHEGKVVVALCFDTSRFPYVVKNPAYGTVSGVREYEVPWREGTRTRSASRNELILMLNPSVKVPKVEILDGEIRFVPMATDPASHELRFTLKVYVVPLSDAPLTFPFHKCQAILSHNGQTISDKFNLSMDTSRGKVAKRNEKMRLASPVYSVEPTTYVTVNAGHETVEVTADEATFRGAGKVEIDGSYGVLIFDKLPELELTVTLIEAITEAKIVLPCKFSKQQSGLAWALNK